MGIWSKIEHNIQKKSERWDGFMKGGFLIEKGGQMNFKFSKVIIILADYATSRILLYTQESVLYRIIIL